MKTLLTTALSNSKKLGKRIELAINGQFYETCFQSAYDLIQEQRRIDAAISLANAQTTITINGKEITLAEAIKLRKLIPIQNQLMQLLKKAIASEQNKTDSAIHKRQQVLESRTQAFLSKDGQVNPAIMEAIRSQVLLEYPDYNSTSLPIMQKQLEKWLVEFSITEEELDTALSVVNATTVIEY